MKSSEKAQTLVNEIQTLTSNPHYRVADVFYRRGWRYSDSQKNILSMSEFEGTILRNYLLSVEDVNSPCFLTLLNVCNEYYIKKPFVSAGSEELVIHIRAGDVIDNSWFLKTSFIEKIQCFHNIKKCTIVTCFAFQEYKERNKWMFSEEKLSKNKSALFKLIKELIEEFPNIEFQVFSSLSQDDDLVYMLKAENFIPDQGGFSELICDLRDFMETGKSKILPADSEVKLIQRKFNSYLDKRLDPKSTEILINQLIELGESDLAQWLLETENHYKASL